MAVTQTHVGSAASKSGTTVTVTIPAGGIPAGDTLVCAVESNGTAQVLDVAIPGHTPTQLAYNGDQVPTTAFSVVKLTAGLVAGDVVSLTSSSGFSKALIVDRFTGLDGTSEAPGSASGSSATPSSTSGTTTNAGDLLLGRAGNRGTTTPTNDPAWTAVTTTGTTGGSGNSNAQFLNAWRLPGATGAFTYATGLGGTSTTWTSGVVALKPAATGPAMVARETAVTYNVLAQVAAERAVTYNVLNVVATERAVAYNVLNLVVADRAIDYSIAGLLTVERAVAYDVLNMVAADRALAYDVLSMVATDRQVTYTVLNQIAAAREFTYNVLNQLTVDRLVAYDVLNMLAATRELAYDVTSTMAVERAVTYDVHNQLAVERAITYDLTGTVVAERVVTYDVTTSSLQVELLVLYDVGDVVAGQAGSRLLMWTGR